MTLFIKPMSNTFINMIFFSVCCAGVLVAEAQTVDTVRRARVKKVIVGQQVGLLGTWFYYERRLVDRITLRGEVGGGFLVYPLAPEGGAITAYLTWSAHATVESRWYYNLGRRMRLSKDITDNNGSFVALREGYAYSAFITFHSDAIRTPAVPVVFMWGMQRNVGHHRHFNYEIGVKVGCWIFPKLASFYFSPHLRIAYRLY